MATLKLSDKLPNCAYFYQGLTQEEIDSIVVQKYIDVETGIVGTVSEVPEFSKNQYVSIGMSFE
jgi:hypothetical protein